MCLKRSKNVSLVQHHIAKVMAMDSDSAQGVLLHHVQVNLVPHQVPDVVNPISGSKCERDGLV